MLTFDYRLSSVKTTLSLQSHAKFILMHMPITSTLFPLTRTARRTYPPTIWGSIYGISTSAIKVLVSIMIRSMTAQWKRMVRRHGTMADKVPIDIVDIKPVNMEELTEVITAAEFHPIHCNLFMYSSSKGTIKLADMRDSALCDQHAKRMRHGWSNHNLSNTNNYAEFEEEEDPTNRSFFSEIISSISDVKFSSDGRYILSRDYLSLKIWDVNMDSRPVKTIDIHDHLRGKLCDLYENDCIFDKFECTFSGDGSWVLKPILFISYQTNFQARSHRVISQLLPNIRRWNNKWRCPASGQVGVQGQEDWGKRPRDQG